MIVFILVLLTLSPVDAFVLMLVAHQCYHIDSAERCCSVASANMKNHCNVPIAYARVTAASRYAILYCQLACGPWPSERGHHNIEWDACESKVCYRVWSNANRHCTQAMHRVFSANVIFASPSSYIGRQRLASRQGTSVTRCSASQRRTRPEHSPWRRRPCHRKQASWTQVPPRQHCQSPAAWRAASAWRGGSTSLCS